MRAQSQARFAGCSEFAYYLTVKNTLSTRRYPHCWQSAPAPIDQSTDGRNQREPGQACPGSMQRQRTRSADYGPALSAWIIAGAPGRAKLCAMRCLICSCGSIDPARNLAHEVLPEFQKYARQGAPDLNDRTGTGWSAVILFGYSIEFDKEHKQRARSFRGTECRN